MLFRHLVLNVFRLVAFLIFLDPSFARSVLVFDQPLSLSLVLISETWHPRLVSPETVVLSE